MRFDDEAQREKLVGGYGSSQGKRAQGSIAPASVRGERGAQVLAQRRDRTLRRLDCRGVAQGSRRLQHRTGAPV